MATIAEQLAVPEAAWRLVDLPPAELDVLRRRCEAIPAEFGLRAALLSLIRPALANNSPEQLQRYDRLEANFPRCAPFAFQSFRSMMVLIAAAGHLFRPDLPLEEASNELAATGTDLIWNLHVMRPLIAACEGDLGRLLEAYAASPRIIFNHGSMLYERRGRSEASVYFDQIYSDPLRFVATGFWLAILRRLGLDGSAEFHVYSPLASELILRW